MMIYVLSLSSGIAISAAIIGLLIGDFAGGFIAGAGTVGFIVIIAAFVVRRMVQKRIASTMQSLTGSSDLASLLNKIGRR